MKKVYLAFGLVGIAFGYLGCAGETTGTGEVVKSCNTDSDCGADLCNTIGHVCMKKCSAASDCPDTAKNCDKIANGGSSDKVCQCSTDQLCGGGSTYCNSVDKLCEVKCTDTSGCTGFNPSRTCTGGQCLPGSVDAGPGTDCTATGAPACATGLHCDTTAKLCVADCTAASCATSGQICNATTKACSACTGAGAQGGCPSGAYCGGTAPALTCTAAVSCTTITNAPATGADSPVVWGVQKTTSRPDTSGTCGGDGNVNKFEGKFYDPNGNDNVASTPGAARYNGIRILTASGSFPAAGNSQENTTVDGTAGTFSFELCSDRADARGVVLVDKDGNKSNAACVSP